MIFVTSFAAAQAPPPTPHTTIYLHGRIYTNDPAHPWAPLRSVVCDGKNQICIGGIEQIMLECGTAEDRETIQLQKSFP